MKVVFLILDVVAYVIAAMALLYVFSPVWAMAYVIYTWPCVGTCS